MQKRGRNSQNPPEEVSVDWGWSEEGGGRTPPKIVYDALGFDLDPIEAVRCRFLIPGESRLTGPVFGPVHIYIGYTRCMRLKPRWPAHRLWVSVSDDERRSATFSREFLSKAWLDTSSLQALVVSMRALLLARNLGYDAGFWPPSRP